MFLSNLYINNIKAESSNINNSYNNYQLYKKLENNNYININENEINIKQFYTNVDEMKTYIKNNYTYGDNKNKFLILNEKLKLFYNNENINIIEFTVNKNIKYYFNFSNLNINNIKLESLYDLNDYILYKKNNIEEYFNKILNKNKKTLRQYLKIENQLDNIFDNYIIYNNENTDLLILRILKNKNIYDVEIKNTDNVYFINNKRYNKKIEEEKIINEFIKENQNLYNYFNFNNNYYCIVNENFEFNLENLKENINILKNNKEFKIKLKDDNIVIEYNDENYIEFKILRKKENDSIDFLKNKLFIEKEEFLNLIKLEQENYNIDLFLKKYINYNEKENISFVYDKEKIKEIIDNNLFEQDINLNIGINLNNKIINKEIILNIYLYEKDLFFKEEKLDLNNFEVIFSSDLYFNKINFEKNIFQKHNSNLKIVEDDIVEYYFLDKNSREFSFKYKKELETINVFNEKFIDISFISYYLKDKKSLHLYIEKKENLNNSSLYNLLEKRLEIILKNYDIYYNNIINNDLIANIENSTSNFYEENLKIKLVHKEKSQDIFIVNILFDQLKEKNKIEEEKLKEKLIEKVENLETSLLKIENEINLEQELREYILKYINLDNINFKINYFDKLQKRISVRFLLKKNKKIYTDTILNFNFKNDENKKNNSEKIVIIKNNDKKILIIIFSIFFILINSLFIIYLILKKIKKI